MNKPLKLSAAIVLYNEDKSQYMKTKRPLDDDSLPGSWGFPAGSKKNQDESWEELVRRVGRDKLGVEVEIIKKMGEETVDRGEYLINLWEFEVKVISGVPSVPQKNKQGTQYVKLEWVNLDDTQDIQQAAKNGGLCSRVFCNYYGIQWES